MITEQQQELASLYAVGALDAAAQAAFERELRGNEELRQFVHQLQRTADLIALSAPAQPLPPGLRAKVVQRIEAMGSEPAAPKSAAPLIPGLSFLDAPGARDWKPLPIPGTYIKLLSLEKERGYAVLMGKLDPGARYPAHTNAGPEDFYILTGDLHIGNRRLGAGDFHHADAGSQHEENYSVEGCTLIAVLTTDDPLVAFAMA
jgi:quercetin dioxygenase-like cupin family protein